MMSVDLIPGSEAPVELLHFTVGAAMWLGRESVHVALSSTPRLDLDPCDSIARVPSVPLRDETTVLVRPSSLAALTLGLGAGATLHLRRPGETDRVSFPLALSPSTLSPFRNERAEPPRILFYGGEENDRRVRMTFRALAELQARRVPFIAVVIGRCASKQAAAIPGEIHSEASATEWGRLIRSSSCIFEATDAHGSPTPAVAAAVAAGRPLVTFRTRADVDGFPGLVQAESWSADAMVDAIRSALDLNPDPFTAPFDRAMSRLREAFDGD